MDLKFKMRNNDFQGIIGVIIAIFFLIIFVSTMIPIFGSINGCDSKQKEINDLNGKIVELNQLSASKDIKISELQAIVTSNNKTLSEQDKEISNLTGRLKERELIIANLTNQLNYFTEKKYLQEISNNYYNISNYFERIENKFFPIEVSISLISITILGLIIKEFALLTWFKSLWKRFKNKENQDAKKTN